MTSGPIEPRLDGELLSPEEAERVAVNQMKEMAIKFTEICSGELARRLESPKEVKKILRNMTASQLLSTVLKTVSALKKPNTVVMPKSFQVNMQQVNQYASEIASNPLSRKELREEARKQLKNRPS